MKKNKTKIILRTVVLIAISVVIGIGAYSCNASTLTGNMMPMPFGVGLGVVLSGSMEPELSVYDLIIVVKKGEYFLGETVVFQEKNILVSHEIVAIDGNTITTKGKTNNKTDAPMDISNIKGKVIFSLPYVGAILGFFKTPIAMTLLLGLAIALLFLSYRREDDEEKAKIENIKQEIAALKSEQRIGASDISPAEADITASSEAEEGSANLAGADPDGETKEDQADAQR